MAVTAFGFGQLFAHGDEGRVEDDEGVRTDLRAQGVEVDQGTVGGGQA
jgi:hypothetical protein